MLDISNREKALFLSLISVQIVLIVYLVYFDEPDLYLPFEEDAPEEGIDPGPSLRQTPEDNHTGYVELKPNETVKWDSDNDFFNMTIVETNEYGLRDRDYSKDPSEKSFRIAAVGDSKTFGYRVNISQTWVKLLENRLQDSYKRTNVEVINFGIYADNIWNKIERVDRSALEYQPDVLIVQLLNNDPENQTRIQELEESYLKEIDNPEEKDKQQARIHAIKTESSERKDMNQEETFELMSKELERLNEVTETEDISVVIIGWDHSPHHTTELRRTAGEYGWTFFTIPEKYKTDEYRIPGDGHPTPEAHDKIADYIQRELEFHNLIPEA